MPTRNANLSSDVSYGARRVSRETARAFWTRSDLEALLERPDVVHANSFWCPIQIESTREIYTFYDMDSTIDPDWKIEANRVGCFIGVFPTGGYWLSVGTIEPRKNQRRLADAYACYLALGDRQCHWYWWSVTAG